MSDEFEYFLSQDGLRLFYRFWKAPENQKVLCIVHGLGEHSGRYDALSHFMNDHNIAVYALDLRGHGLSQGKRGHAKSYDLLLSDVEELLKTARAEFTELPLFLMGHSMGGNIVANYMIEKITNDISGFICSSPWLKLAFSPPEWKLKLGKLAGQVFPRLTQENGLDPELLSRDPEIMKVWENDKLVHNKISAGLFNLISKSGESAILNAGKIKKPGLAYHGTGDGVTDWKSTEKFVKNGRKIDWKLLEGVHHEPHNDYGRDEVYEMILNWMKAHS